MARAIFIDVFEDVRERRRLARAGRSRDEDEARLKLFHVKHPIFIRIFRKRADVRQQAKRSGKFSVRMIEMHAKATAARRDRGIGSARFL